MQITFDLKINSLSRQELYKKVGMNQSLKFVSSINVFFYLSLFTINLSLNVKCMAALTSSFS